MIRRHHSRRRRAVACARSSLNYGWPVRRPRRRRATRCEALIRSSRGA